MTIKVVNVQDGDYKLRIKSGGTITLDTSGDNPGSGTVYITGDLLVQGNTTTVNTVTLTVEDNIITLNSGEVGNGISITNGFVSGIEIERGNYFNAQFLFDELISHRNSTGTITAGTFKLVDSIGSSIGLKTPSIVVGSNQNLYLVNQGTGYVTVTGTVNYERNIFDYTQFDASTGPIVIGPDPDALVNAQAVIDFFTSYTSYSTLDNINAGNTRVKVFDTSEGDPYSKVEFRVDNIIEAEVTQNGLFINDLQLRDNVITTQNTSADLVLRAASDLIEIDGYVILRDQPSLLSTQLGTTAVFSTGTLGPGDSGIYFVNTRSDELVSKRRALLFSFIF